MNKGQICSLKRDKSGCRKVKQYHLELEKKLMNKIIKIIIIGEAWNIIIKYFFLIIIAL